MLKVFDHSPIFRHFFLLQLKSIGIQKIGELRSELIQTLWMKRKELKRTEMDSWARVTDVKLQTFNEYLYKAFKEHYVKQVVLVLV